jgi:hypothetical protein
MEAIRLLVHCTTNREKKQPCDICRTSGKMEWIDDCGQVCTENESVDLQPQHKTHPILATKTASVV